MPKSKKQVTKQPAKRPSKPSKPQAEKPPVKPAPAPDKPQSTPPPSRQQFKAKAAAPVNAALATLPDRLNPKKNNKKAKKRRDNRLTYQQQAFIDALLADPARNASNAARESGYAQPGSMGCQLLDNPKIKNEIARLTRRSSMSAADTLFVLGELAQSDMNDFVSINPKTKKVRYDLAKAVRLGKTHLIKVLLLDEVGNVKKIELHDKAPYLQMIAKNHGLLTERVQVDVSVDRSAARNDLASRLAGLLTAQPIALPNETGNVTGFRAIDVTESSSQPVDTKGDTSKH